MALLLRVLFWIVIISLVRFVLSRLFAARQPAARRAPRPDAPPTVTGRMIKDPHCGIYVASELAVSAQSEGRTLHFCSRRCRDHYLQALAERGAARRAG